MKTYKYHYLYRTTNLINGKIYIGVHFTNNLYDAYLGSGGVFLKALKKYGKESFEREIIYRFQNHAQAFFCESIIVNKEFVDRDDTYNTSLGGRAGTGMLGKTQPKSARKKIGDFHRGKIMSDESKRKMSILAKQRTGVKNSFYDKQHSSETKSQIAKSLSKSNSAEGNPCYGKRGMHDPNTLKGKYILLTEIDVYESKGWRMGLKPRSKPIPRQWKFSQTQVECPHCGKTGGKGAMHRYHFDNCKFANVTR